jgi:1,4-alpha-glucan branching enzyme
VWLDHSNDWIYRHLHKAADRMVDLANRFPEASGLVERTLNQAARELLLAQASDWAFIMKAGTMVEYACRRTQGHLVNFDELYHQVTENRIDTGFLQALEDRDNIFPTLNFRVYASDEKRAPLTVIAAGGS